MSEEEIKELAYLRWFNENVDFGPADYDVHVGMQSRYKSQTGNEVPEEYKYE